MVALLTLAMGVATGASAGAVCLDGTPKLASGTDFLPIEVCVDSETGLVSRVSVHEGLGATTATFNTSIGTVLGGCADAATPVLSRAGADVKVTRTLACPQQPSGKPLWATVVDTYSMVRNHLRFLAFLSGCAAPPQPE